MANTPFINGFTPQDNLHGGEPARPRLYYLKSGSIVFRGDMVKGDGGGGVTPITTASTDVPIGVAAAYGNDILSSGTVQVPIYDDPDGIFSADVRSGTGGTELTQADIFQNAYPNIGTGGSTTTSLSGQFVEADNHATTSTMPLQVIGLVPITNNAWGRDAQILVRFNNHQYRTLTGI